MKSISYELAEIQLNALANTLVVTDRKVRYRYEQIQYLRQRAPKPDSMPSSIISDRLNEERKHFQAVLDQYSVGLQAVKNLFAADPVYKKCYLRMRVKNDFKLPIDV